jgi:hypothetical protein
MFMLPDSLRHVDERWSRNTHFAGIGTGVHDPGAERRRCAGGRFARLFFRACPHTVADSTALTTANDGGDVVMIASAATPR